jgi:predicted PurR-regulated permease PerM
LGQLAGGTARSRRAAQAVAAAETEPAPAAVAAGARTAGSTGDAGGEFGRPGAPLNRHSPFYLGLFGGLGLAVAYGLVLSVARLSQVVTLLAVAVFLALGLDPVVRFLQRRGLSRGWAVTAVFAGVIVVFAALVGLLLPPLAAQGTQLANNAPDYVESLLRNPQVKHLDQHYHVVTRLQEQLKGKLSDGQVWTDVFGGVLGAGRAAVSGIFSAFTVLVLTLYLTASLPTVKEVCYRAVPASRRDRVRTLGDEITRRVGGYVIGQIAVASTNAICTYILLRILGLPYPEALAVLVGFLGLIPMVGATLGAIVVVLVALFSSVTTAVVAAIYYVIYQQLENYVIAPRVMKRTIAVPGAVTVIAALAGGTLLGVIGALMAIPTAAGLILIYQEVLVPRQEQH